MRSRLSVCVSTLLLMVLNGTSTGCNKTHINSGPSFMTYSHVTEAQALADGHGTLVAVLDWQFDLKGKEALKYVYPTSLVEGEEIGKLKPWHGEWMAGIVHAIAPQAMIMPIKARGTKDRANEYESRILSGIRMAADHGAVAVCSSMGPLADSAELLEVIAYAEERGTLFVNVHPEVVSGDDGRRRLGRKDELSPLILHPGPVSVPDHPETPAENRDIYTWPYDLDAEYEDGWGYSNCPPQVAGTIALIRSANPELTNDDVRRIIVETAYLRDGFRVLDTQASVRAAIEMAQGSVSVSPSETP